MSVNEQESLLVQTPPVCPHKWKKSNDVIITLEEHEKESRQLSSAPGELVDELVYFNVSGRIFTTTAFTLNVFPDALLGSKEKRDSLSRTKNGEIFLNRNPEVFASILTFYQTGIFEIPDGINQNIFVRDVKYYGLESEAKISGLNGFIKRVKPKPKNKTQAFIWNVLEYPDSSTLARVVSMFSLTTIITSIVVFCWETIPAYKEPYVNDSYSRLVTVKALADIEIFCIAYFSVELVARFLSSPKKIAFMKSFLNIIDFVSIVPFFIDFAFQMEGDISIYFLRAIRLVRVFRVFKLSRHSSEMKILGIAVKDSARELGVLLFFILLGVLLFSSAIYYAEISQPGTKLSSIPGAFWWSIVTMTTVGYGDETPISTAGKLVGAVCAMSGILVIAMPIPIIVNNFARHYQRLKPVSKYWYEFQKREEIAKAQLKIINTFTLGLYKINDLRDCDLLVPPSFEQNHRSNQNNSHFDGSMQTVL